MPYLTQIHYPTLQLQPSKKDPLGTGWLRGQFLDWCHDVDPALGAYAHSKNNAYRSIQFRNVRTTAAIVCVGTEIQPYIPQILERFRPEVSYVFTQEYYPELVVKANGLHTYHIPHFLLSNNYAKSLGKKYTHHAFTSQQDLWDHKVLFEKRITGSISFLLEQLGIIQEFSTICIIAMEEPRTLKVGQKANKDILRTVTALSFTTSMELPSLGSLGAELALGYGVYQNKGY